MASKRERKEKYKKSYQREYTPLYHAPPFLAFVSLRLLVFESG
jgi:hypothetical protein